MNKFTFKLPPKPQETQTGDNAAGSTTNTCVSESVLVLIVATITIFLQTTIALWVLVAFAIVGFQVLHVIAAFVVHLEQENLELDDYHH